MVWRRRFSARGDLGWVLGSGGRDGAGPGRGDGFESLPFVGSVAFDRLDNVGDQVVAAFDLNVDL
jgi:hypothetical protein